LRAQAEGLQDEDPARRFVSLVISVLSSGRGHLKTRSGETPGFCPGLGGPAALGWQVRQSQNFEEDYLPRGDCIGYTTDQPGVVLLDPAASFAAASSLADAVGAPLVTSRTQIWKALDSGGYLTERDRTRPTVRRRIAEGVRTVASVRLGDLSDAPYRGVPTDSPCGDDSAWYRS